MPDLSIEIWYTCDTNILWMKQVKGSKATHTVTWDNHSHRNRDVQYDYSCSCEAFKFGKGKPCKHIEAVKSERCGWDGFMDHDKVKEINGAKCCPRCGGPVTPIKHAV